MNQAMAGAVIGIDVGSTSARAGVFDAYGRLLATARHPIRTWHEPGEIVEQSSDDIWDACVRSVREAVRESGVAAGEVRGIGFDATCSLVVLDPRGRPLAAGPSGDPQRNVVVWMDHRAGAETREINAGRADVLRYVGGQISPEMQTPKLLWLKRHAPASYYGAGHFLDLADFLSLRATGSDARSTCTVTCKWTYLAHERRWSDAFFESIGLGDLSLHEHARIGRRIVEPGTALGSGLTVQAAAELGLPRGIAVGASLIDAHAGAIGTLGSRGGDAEPDVDACSRLAYIMGTSACVMASSRDARFVPGVWGPYYSALLPGLWLIEGGQSAAGAAIDHLVQSHPASADVARAAARAGLDPLGWLEAQVLARCGHASDSARLAAQLHVLPEFLGNRSPHADPDARAIVAGLDLNRDLDQLERLFVATLCGLGYGLAEVIESMRNHGVAGETIVASGGASRSPLVRQLMADTTGLAIAQAATAEPVLLGASMLGAVAAGLYPDIPSAMRAMSRLGGITRPSPAMAELHARKRRAHAVLRRTDRDLRTAMAERPLLAD